MKGVQLALPVVAAAGLIVGAVGVPSADWQPSALRLGTTAVIAVLAPLYWPGQGVTRGRTALRIFASSFAAACLAAIVVQGAGGGRQPVERTLAACAMLMLVLVATFAVAAALERRLRGMTTGAEDAREIAGRIATFGLALVGSLPLWLGPTAEIMARRAPWFLDAAMAVSPLTHLAVASGNDLLRNEWFYRHSNLAALHVSYPSATAFAVGYVITVMVVCALALRNEPASIDAGARFMTEGVDR